MIRSFSMFLGQAAALVSAVTFALSAQAQASVSDRIVIRSGDMVEIKVFREEDLSGKVRVSSNGEVSVPLIGLVRVGGKTPEEASEAIKARLADGYLVQPDVLVTVSDYAKQFFTIIGQVQKPGTYEMPANGQITLLQAIGVAGGYTRIANTSKILIKRSVGDGERVFEVNAKRLSKESGTSAYYLQPGDVITIAESLF